MGASAFRIPTMPHRSGVVTSRSILCSQLKSTSENKSESSDDAIADYDVSCFIVNEEEILADGEKPHVVCTAEPEEYAWFNGIDPKMMVKTEDAIEGAVECKEGESYKGKPEWECA
ncbi:hypothetical protein HJC23_003140 [Cyclotella cryptica]|uniref:Uncharacterized protein n=1 Tax=Cyclotella cryptica TaxID=29204 RepID=A0ABD3P602_9STRA